MATLFSVGCKTCDTVMQLSDVRVITNHADESREHSQVLTSSWSL